MSANDLEGRELLCSGPGETRALARWLAQYLDASSVVALEGPLGAGKTEFAKGLAEGLGCADEVTSPTFAVAHEYPGGRHTVFHFDFYRLDSAEEILTSGFEDCLGSGVVVVEWASRFASCLPAGTLWVRIEIQEDGMRKVALSREAGL